MLVGLRFMKQLIIAAIVAVIFGAIVFLGLYSFRTPTATPTPDPRAQLMALEVLETHLFAVDEQDYDMLAKIRNPNVSYGSGTVRYELELYYDDSANQETKLTIPGSFYILPGQTKYIARSPIKTSSDITKSNVKIISVEWQELDALALQGVNIATTTSPYVPNDQGGKVGGSVTNGTDFDFSVMDVVVVLFDDDQQPVGVNQTEIRTFVARTTRGFEVSWFSPLEKTIQTTLTEANANLFLNSTFIGAHGGTEQFQEY